MKKLLPLLMLLLPALALAQSRVDAKEIVDKINRCQAVSYQHATIDGKLDFTRLNNRKLQDESGSWTGEASKTYISTVNVPVRFTNCTFAGDVLAYEHLEDSRETNNANFGDNVVFENCTFKGESAFKYTRFAKGASFAGSRFHGEALFKYSHFRESPGFSRAKFEEEANFKYASFSGPVHFDEATFRGEADFKYTRFPARSSLRSAVFAGHANFKYAKFSEPVDLSGVDFRGGEDFKYTSVGGKSMSAYLYTHEKRK